MSGPAARLLSSEAEDLSTAPLKPSVASLFERFYPVSDSGVRYRDGTRPFFEWILDGIDAPNSIVLDVGAGPASAPERSLFGKVRRLAGVDSDPSVLQNKRLDEAYVNDGVRLPFEDESFDAVYSDWTIEHVTEPLPFLREINRVLKPGGSYWFRTSNLLHYATVVSAITPHWFHRLVANRVRALPADQHDPWPVRYRMNTPRKVRKTLLLGGFDPPEIRLIESHPSYFMFSPWAFRAGVLYERTVNRTEALSQFRFIILGRARRPGPRRCPQDSFLR